jgi:transposase-like protein
MPPRIDDDKRAEILNDIQAGVLSRNAIARKHGVASSTVAVIADENGIEDAFDRTKVENATRARTADMRARRALLAEGLLVDAELLRDRAWSKYPIAVTTMKGPELVELPAPPLDQIRNAYVAVGIALQRHMELVKHDADTGATEVKSMLGSLATGLEAAYKALKAEDASAGEDAEAGLDEGDA